MAKLTAILLLGLLAAAHAADKCVYRLMTICDPHSACDRAFMLALFLWAMATHCMMLPAGMHAASKLPLHFVT